MSGLLSQLGVVKETTWGTAVAVSKFIEFDQENIKGVYARVDSKALRSGTRMQRSDRFAVNPKGAAGDLQFPVMSKNFAFWLEHMLGSVATTGPAETVVYTHTGTVGSLTGKSFTCQVGRPQVGTATVTPFTYEGGKVTSWELSNDVDGLLNAKIACDFEMESSSGASAYSLQAATYPSAMEVLAFTGGTVNVAGSAVDVKNVTISCDNGLKTDRFFTRSNSLKKEQLESSVRAGKVSMTLDFDSLTQYARVASATAAGAVATFSATWDGPAILTGATTLKAKVTVTLPAIRFDVAAPTVNGPDLVDLPVEAMIMDSGSGSPITIAVQTLDVTP